MNTPFAAQWIAFVVLYTLSAADDLSCLCNQFSSGGCVQINATWGACTQARGQGLCVATWQKILADNSTVVQYSCSDSALLMYTCLPTGSVISGTPQYPIVTACCQGNYCNTPNYLQAMVGKLLQGPTPTSVMAVSPTDGVRLKPRPPPPSTPTPTPPRPTSTVSLIPTTSAADKLTCLCTEFSVPGCVRKNSTWGECTLAKGAGLCTTSWERILNSTAVFIKYGCEMDAILPYACLPQGYTTRGNSQYPIVITCCTSDYCNTLARLQSVLSSLLPGSTATSQTTSTTLDALPLPSYVIPLMASLSVAIVVVTALLLTFLVLRLHPRLLPSSHKTADLGITSPSKRGGGDSRRHPSTLDVGVDHSSEDSGGSGSGLPLLSQQSIAAQIVLEELVGKGRFGEVWRGAYKGDSVAVKIFHTREEVSWNHEVDIYQTCLLRHPNVLRYVASDSKDMGMQMQLWLITEFCEHGSLYDYLQTHALDEVGVLRLCHTATCGLNHLHSEIVGREGKPGIAHRDLKTRNILVKGDGVCCIADLGLGLRYDRVSDSVEELPSKRVGTRRYLAPEVITETIGTRNFESFKRADMYSFGLVMWEVARRGICGGTTEEAQLPYFDSLPPDPTLDDMQRVVVMEKRRPSIPTGGANLRCSALCR
eukprot:Em0003g682a